MLAPLAEALKNLDPAQAKNAYMVYGHTPVDTLKAPVDDNGVIVDRLGRDGTWLSNTNRRVESVGSHVATVG